MLSILPSVTRYRGWRDAHDPTTRPGCSRNSRRDLHGAIRRARRRLRRGRGLRSSRQIRGGDQRSRHQLLSGYPHRELHPALRPQPQRPRRADRELSRDLRPYARRPGEGGRPRHRRRQGRRPHDLHRDAHTALAGHRPDRAALHVEDDRHLARRRREVRRALGHRGLRRAAKAASRRVGFLHGRRNAQGTPRHDRARLARDGARARLRRYRGDQAPQRRRVRSSGGDHLPCAAPARGRGPARRPLDHGRVRPAAAHLFADPARRAGARRAARDLGEILRSRRQPAQGEPGLITEYVERLAGLLAFDPPLSRRVRREVEDHLREAAAAYPSGGREAERRAIAAFGEPSTIAAQFAAVSLAKRARRAGAASVLLTAAVFVAMKARIAWYGLIECPGVDLGVLGQVVVSLDRYAFWLSGLVAIAGWMYIDSRGVPAGFTPEYRAQLRRFSLVSAAVAAALTVSVASDGLLTSLRLVQTAWSVGFLLPVFSVAVEVVCAGVLISHVFGLARRASAADRQVATAGSSR